MITKKLNQLAQQLELDCDSNFKLRIEFGVACAEHVEHLLTDQSIIDLLAVGKGFVHNRVSEENLKQAAQQAMKLARTHPGSGSIDGAGSAAVSSSFGVAAALAGNALVAAEYTAYASVYAYAGFAVSDLSAYTEVHDWQYNKLIELSARQTTL